MIQNMNSLQAGRKRVTKYDFREMQIIVHGNSFEVFLYSMCFIFKIRLPWLYQKPKEVFIYFVAESNINLRI